jgi:hypothetical protein
LVLRYLCSRETTLFGGVHDNIIFVYYHFVCFVLKLAYIDVAMIDLLSLLRNRSLILQIKTALVDTWQLCAKSPVIIRHFAFFRLVRLPSIHNVCRNVISRLKLNYLLSLLHYSLLDVHHLAVRIAEILNLGIQFHVFGRVIILVSSIPAQEFDSRVHGLHHLIALTPCNREA